MNRAMSASLACSSAITPMSAPTACVSPSRGQNPPQSTPRRRFDGIDDFLGLDVEDFRASLDALTFAHPPRRDGALGHLDAPFGHGDGADAGGHYASFSA